MSILPNQVDVPYLDQARLLDVDFLILQAADSNTGIISGCGVTGSGGTTVAVAAGTVLIGGLRVAVAAGNVAVGAGDATYGRYDLITVDSSGVPVLTAGVAAAVPLLPKPSAFLAGTAVALGAVFVPPGATTVPANTVVAKGVKVQDPGLTRTPILGSKIVIHGHSLWTGGGSTSPDNSVGGFTGALLKTPVNNMALGGAVLGWHESSSSPYITTATGDGGWVQVFQRQDFLRSIAPYLPRPQLSIVGYGNNDLGWGHVLGVYQEVLRAVLAYMSAGRIIPDTDPLIRYSGGWPARVAATNTNYGSGYRPAAANAEVVTVVAPSDFPGGTISLFFVCTPSSAGRVTFAISGVGTSITAPPGDGSAAIIGLTGTDNMSGARRTYQKAGAQKNVPAVFRVQNLPASRTDAASWGNATATVIDAAITAADAGRAVTALTGTGIPAIAFVGTVTPGVSFLLSTSPNSQVNANTTAAGSGTLSIAPVIRATVTNRGTLATPAAPTVTPTGGAAGSYTYAVSAVNSVGDTVASTTTTIANGPTTLDASHFNTITWTPVPNATGYRVRRTAGGPSTGQIAVTTGNDPLDCSVKDTGLAGSVYTLPGSNAADAGYFFNFATVLASPAPAIMVPGLFRPLNQASYDGTYTNWPAGTTTDADVATWNAGIKSGPLAEFPMAQFVDIDVVRGITPSGYGPDTVHPNDFGHLRMAQQLVAAINNAAAVMTQDQVYAQSREPRYGERAQVRQFTEGDMLVTATSFAILTSGGVRKSVFITAQPGDTLKFEPVGGWGGENTYGYLDAVTILNNAIVNYFSSSGAAARSDGVRAWVAASGVFYGRSVTGVASTASNVATFAAGAALTADDIGAQLVGAGATSGANVRLLYVTSPTTAVLSAAISMTASAYTLGGGGFNLKTTNTDAGAFYDKIAGPVHYTVTPGDLGAAGVGGWVEVGLAAKILVPPNSTATGRTIYCNANDALVLSVENLGILSPYQAG